MGKGLRIKEHDLGGNGLEAYYFEKPSFRAMAIEPSVDAARYRLWELVAHGLVEVPGAERRMLGRQHEPGGFYFFGAKKGRDADALAVRAIAEVIEEMEPRWTSAVEEAPRMSDAPEVIAAWCGVPVEAVCSLVRPSRPETRSPDKVESKPGAAGTPRPSRGQEKTDPTLQRGKGMEEPIKPPALGGLDGFELWDRTVRAPAHIPVKTAFVSVRVGGNVGMNKAAYKMWGEPEACQVMYDPERRRIAFRPVDPEEPNSFDLGRSGLQVPCKSLFDHYGVEIKQTRRYHDPAVLDGILIVDL